MLNPFQDFRAYAAPRRELPLDQILARRDQVLQRLMQGYQALVEEESKQLIWVVEQGALSRAYTTALEALRGVEFAVEDLEDMCLELDTHEGYTTSMGAPSGLFIAAMCNSVEEETVTLNLRPLRRRLPFLGYRLPRGRKLFLEGDAGDFVGALLEGGEIEVTGNAGNYAGIGMKSGLLHIRYSTGKYTAEGMRGGTLRIGGRIGELGRPKQGTVYEGESIVFPARATPEPTSKARTRAAKTS
ncbi:MAG: hypothetical protein AB7N91_29795 [Candidatus Tectimicrobiota bacterium]